MYHLDEGDTPLVAVGFVVSGKFVLIDYNFYTRNFPMCCPQIGLDYSNPHLSPFKEFQVKTRVLINLCVYVR